MESSFIPMFLLLLTIVHLAQSQMNSTDTSNQTTTFIQCSDPSGNPGNCTSNVTSPDLAEKAIQSPLVPPLWCPDGYRLMRTQDQWVHACQPMSCSGPPKNATRCVKMSRDLQECSKIFLTQDEYRLDPDDSLVSSPFNLTLPLGDYVIDSTRAIICDPAEWNETMSESSNWAELPRWCMPIPVAKDGYRTTDLGLFVDVLGHEVNLFAVDENGTAHACPELDPIAYESCADPGILPGDEIEVLPNWDVQDTKNFLVRAIFHLGSYVLAVDKSFVLICITPAEPLSEGATYAYGVASMFSALCLLLALLAHLFFPTLNYHTKALLCFAFSMFVMYIAVAIRSFCGNFESAAGNMLLFSVQYIFGLASFFWLGILSFDLWKVFSDMRGTITPGNTTGKKRVFFIKGAYAWGIPTLLCILVIILSYYPEAQKSLKLDLPLQTSNWMTDTTTMLIIFYTPISIVLIENVVFFILTIINLRKASSGADILKHNKLNRKLFRVYMKLFLVMGLCWFAEVISWLAMNKTGEAVWYVTDIINCLQGVFIFLIYICKKKTILIIKNKMGQISASQVFSSTSSTNDSRKISSISMQGLPKNRQRCSEKSSQEA